MPERYEEIVAWWQEKRIRTEADLAEAMHSHSILFAYNSGKLENDSITYYDTRDVFERGRVSSYTGDVRTLFEIQNAKTADAFFLQSFGAGRELDESLLLEMHTLLTAGTYDSGRWQKGERPGQYKVGDCIVGRNEAGAAPEEAAAEVRSLLEELQASGQLSGGAVLTAAAYFHASFENIHPFADGNGRVGRLAMNYYLIRQDHPPIIIHEEDRRQYYEALHAWDAEEQLEPLLQFLREQTVKTWEKQLLRREGTKRPKGKTLLSLL